MNITLIDNYDSFAYNLAHLLRELGATVRVFRNDRFTLDDLLSTERLILSPGPGIPEEAGQLMACIGEMAERCPILGVCLGHQAIGQFFGGQLKNLENVYHGVQTPCSILTDDALYAGLPRRITVGRYHSWVVDRESLPDCLEVTAVSDEGHIMSMKHRTLKICGIQYHPESVLTPDGRTIIENWLNS